MCQFINHNSIYGSKIITHTIIESIIIFGSPMPWKKKIDFWWPLDIRVKVPKKKSKASIKKYTHTNFYNKQIP
jgi:hypothetical protein